MRLSNAVKIVILISSALATLYAIRVYLGRVKTLPEAEKSEVVFEKQVEHVEKVIEMKQDDPQLANNNKGNDPLQLPELRARGSVCDMTRTCGVGEIPFQVMSGAANIIGPSICVGGKWLMSNSLGNVGRGMNVAVVDGATGIKKSTKVFDVYGTESEDLKQFLNALESKDIALIATYDDATQKLKEDARSVLTNMGSKHAKTLAFRDNWIFVAGKMLQERSHIHEMHKKNDREVNRFGNWPAGMTLEECIPKL